MAHDGIDPALKLGRWSIDRNGLSGTSGGTTSTVGGAVVGVVGATGTSGLPATNTGAMTAPAAPVPDHRSHALTRSMLDAEAALHRDGGEPDALDRAAWTQEDDFHVRRPF